MSSDKVNRIIGIAIVVAIIVFGFLWFIGFKINNQSPVPTPVNKIESSDNSQAPADFPKQIPIETGAKIVSSYDATSPDGRVQATVTFQSFKSMADNFKFYKDYLTKNGWRVMAQSSTLNTKFILAQDKSGILNITIHATNDTTKSLVDLSFLLNK